MASIYTKPLSIDRHKEWHLYFLGDTQLGSSSTLKGPIRARIAEIANDPLAAWAFLGDITDDDRPTTRARKRQTFYDREEVLTNAGRDHCAWLDRDVIPMLMPLAGKPCLGVLAGHHWAQILPGLNSVQYILREMMRKGRKAEHLPYLGQMSAWVWLPFTFKGRTTVRRLLHIQHGVGGGSATGSALKKLELARHSFAADIYVRAHDCALEAAKKDVLAPRETGSSLEARTATLLNIGAATQGYTLGVDEPAYPEMSMLPPRAIGWGMVRAIVRKAHSWEDAAKNYTVEFRAEI